MFSDCSLRVNKRNVYTKNQYVSYFWILVSTAVGIYSNGLCNLRLQIKKFEFNDFGQTKTTNVFITAITIKE